MALTMFSFKCISIAENVITKQTKEQSLYKSLNNSRINTSKIAHACISGASTFLIKRLGEHANITSFYPKGQSRLIRPKPLIKTSKVNLSWMLLWSLPNSTEPPLLLVIKAQLLGQAHGNCVFYYHALLILKLASVSFIFIRLLRDIIKQFVIDCSSRL